MGIINILDAQLANQIAAGEVVERPSSVVKELVENAIDAGSSRIDVLIEEGGLQLIRVTDNGTGMEPDDVEKAFLRHATSKIATTNDLFSIRTLGFRGEALPSIAAVSKLELVTCSNTSALGTGLWIEGGALVRRAEKAAPRGTDIAVRELFYNTPARLKYMKTIQTELGHVTDYMYRLALAYPGIGFTLRHNGSVLLQTLGNGDLLNTIAAIYGTSVARAMLRIEGETLDYKLTGYIAKPELTRANRGAISTIINGRYIRSYPLVQALLQGYHTLLPINRYPVAVLQLQMDPTLVDVNVHPSKLEVRFSKEQELLQFVQREARDVLAAQRLIPDASSTQVRKPREAVIQEQLELYRTGPAIAAAPPQTGGGSEPKLDMSASVRSDRAAGPQDTASQPTPASSDLGRSWPPVNSRSSAEADTGRARTSADRVVSRAEGRSDASAAAAPRPGAAAPGDARRSKDTAAVSEALLRALSTESDKAPAMPSFPKLHPIGQLHGTYIVAQNEEGLFLIDQHAAHERINYEYYYDMFGKPEAASQELLVPITLHFTPVEAARLQDKLPQLEQAGVYLEPFGGHDFLVRAYPHWLPKGEEQSLIDEMIEWLLSERKQVDLSKLREKAAIMCSCKASIKANQSMGMLEMEVLLDRLAACRNPYTCPHGRPIVVSFSTYELEKMFKRVM